MVDHEGLLHRARRAYEVGRWKMAARALTIVIPLAILCILLSGRPLVCLGLAILLGAAVVVLRWRNRQSGRVANVGLTAGILPLTAGVLISQVGSMSSPVLCMSICIASGVVAGAWAGYAVSKGGSRAIDWPAALTVALLTASLGCIDLGTSMLTAVTLALLGSGILVGLIQWQYRRTAA